jgi:hypothetical protein
MNENDLFYTSGCGRITMHIKAEDASYGSQQGECDAYIADLRTVPYIREQLDKVDPDNLRRHLKDCGYEIEKLEDHDDNLDRLLFMVCCDMREEHKLSEDELEQEEYYDQHRLSEEEEKRLLSRILGRNVE